MAKMDQVVIMIHGIRDQALWQVTVKSALETHFEVQSTNYGRFDLLRFLLPIPYFRNQAIESVWDQIRDIRRQFPEASLSFIAHSFGTYILSEILRREFDFTAHRIIFCGSIVRYDFPFAQFSQRFTAPLINEVGEKDFWPAMAESATWGYGSAGTYGFKRTRFIDRWHRNAHHGYFLNREFCRKYWLPFLRDGKIVPGEKEPRVPSFWVQLISIFRLKYLAILLMVIFVVLSFGLNKLPLPWPADACYPIDPTTDRPNTKLPPRECLVGRITYVKWTDLSDYDAVDPATGRWPNSLANRSLSASSIEEDGTVIWKEQNLLRESGGKKYWQNPPEIGWTEIVYDSSSIVPGQTGTLIRRQDTTQNCQSSGRRVLLEAFVPSDLMETFNDRAQQRMMMFRNSYFKCAEVRPLGLATEYTDFNMRVGPFVTAYKE